MPRRGNFFGYSGNYNDLISISKKDSYHAIKVGPDSGDIIAVRIFS